MWTFHDCVRRFVSKLPGVAMTSLYRAHQLLDTIPATTRCAGVTRIGISYDKLCSSVSPGKRILMADGAVSGSPQTSGRELRSIWMDEWMEAWVLIYLGGA
jgi:hypothetical protein